MLRHTVCHHRATIRPEVERVEAATGTFFEWEGHRTWYRVIGEITRGRTTAGDPLPRRSRARRTTTSSRWRRSQQRAARACSTTSSATATASTSPTHRPSSGRRSCSSASCTRWSHTSGPPSAYHVVGQSWGGMLAMLHALEHPAGLRAISVCNSPASMRLWVAEANRLRLDLPADVQATLTKHETDGTTDSPEYEAATQVFYERHVCRLPVWPEFVKHSFAMMAANPTVYHTMNGPSEFHTIGSLLDWDITDRLPGIDVPTLLISGEFDEATPYIVEQIHSRIPGARWELVAGTSHLTHVEEPEIWVELVGGFLDGVDAKAGRGRIGSAARRVFDNVHADGVVRARTRPGSRVVRHQGAALNRQRFGRAGVALALAGVGLAIGATSALAAPQGHQAAHDGGTLKLTYQGALGSLDPHINYTLAGLAARAGHAGRARQLQEGAGHRGLHGRARPRGRDPEADRTAARPGSSSCARASSSRTARSVKPSDVARVVPAHLQGPRPDRRRASTARSSAPRVPEDRRDLHAQGRRRSATTRRAPSRST